jgi:hypothetical protein
MLFHNISKLFLYQSKIASLFVIDKFLCFDSFFVSFFSLSFPVYSLIFSLCSLQLCGKSLVYPMHVLRTLSFVFLYVYLNVRHSVTNFLSLYYNPIFLFFAHIFTHTTFISCLTFSPLLHPFNNKS